MRAYKSEAQQIAQHLPRFVHCSKFEKAVFPFAKPIGKMRTVAELEEAHANATDSNRLIEQMARVGEDRDLVSVDLRKLKRSSRTKFNLLLRLIQSIAQWNKTEPDLHIVMFFKYNLDRAAAAIRIQMAYRSYRIRCLLRAQLDLFRRTERNALLTLISPPCEVTVFRCVIELRAAYCIQSNWKMYRLRQRISLIKQLTSHLSEIRAATSTLYLQEDMYLEMQHILDVCRPLNKIPEADCLAFWFSTSQVN